MKLYHISKDYNKTIETFIPRIPAFRAAGEDKEIKRICTSSTINGCLNGEPSINYDVYYYPQQDFFCPYEYMGKMKTLLDHKEAVGHLVKVYEFEIDEAKVITPEKLLNDKLVPDAMISKEHWITETISPIRSFFILIKNASELENKEIKYEYDIFEKKELGKITFGDYHYRKERDPEYKVELEIIN
jgi:hypothetical protein